MTEEQTYQNLYSFLCAEFADADLEGKSDEEVILSCTQLNETQWYRQIIAEGRTALDSPSFPWHQVANYANRYLPTEKAVRKWLTQMIDLLEQNLD